VVVPCYNEERRLQPAKFVDFIQECDEAHLFLMDDGSADGTWKILDGIRALAPDRVTTVKLARNSGKAEAVRVGVNEALASHFRYVAYWDADLATPLSEVSTFLDVFREQPKCRLVMGSRVRLLGRDIQRRPGRHYLGRIFATAASLALRLPVYDTQCGAKMFAASSDLAEVFSEPFTDPWIFDVEVLFRLTGLWGAATADRIVEVPLTTWRDVGGSKLKARDGLRAAMGVLRIWVRGR
jgi:glycosyltransferase involved in cell wall biosynthesis